MDSFNDKADVDFIKDINDLTRSDQLHEDLRKLMMCDDVKANEPVINVLFCSGGKNHCDMVYLNQNQFSLNR